MTHVGLDVGKRKINVFVRYDDGKTREWEINASREDVIALSQDDLPEKSVCAIEASVSTWTIARILLSFDHEVKTLNPADAKADAARQRKKTDKLDARMLCNLLTMAELKTVWIPDEKTERLRMIASHLRKIVKMKTMYKNEIQAIFQRHMLLCPLSDLFGESGLFWLKEQEKNLNEEDIFIIKWNLEKISELKKREDEVVAQMARVCGEDEIIEKALQVEGVGIKSALLLKARVGTMHRFQEGKQVPAYCGVVPKVQESGDWEGSNRITKRGDRYLRGVMTEGMRSAILKEATMQKFYLQIRGHDQKKGNKAIIACVSKALRIIWTICVKKENYKALDARLYARKLRNYQKMAGLLEGKKKTARAATAKQT